jgi:hypothetical protein
MVHGYAARHLRLAGKLALGRGVRLMQMAVDALVKRKTAALTSRLAERIVTSTFDVPSRIQTRSNAARMMSASAGSGWGAAPAAYSLCILSSSGSLYSRGSTKLTWCPRAASCAFKNRAYLIPCRSLRTDP